MGANPDAASFSPSARRTAHGTTGQHQRTSQPFTTHASIPSPAGGPWPYSSPSSSPSLPTPMPPLPSPPESQPPLDLPSVSVCAGVPLLTLPPEAAAPPSVLSSQFVPLATLPASLTSPLLAPPTSPLPPLLAAPALRLRFPAGCLSRMGRTSSQYIVRSSSTAAASATGQRAGTQSFRLCPSAVRCLHQAAHDGRGKLISSGCRRFFGMVSGGVTGRLIAATVPGGAPAIRDENPLRSCVSGVVRVSSSTAIVAERLLPVGFGARGRIPAREEGGRVVASLTIVGTEGSAVRSVGRMLNLAAV